MPPAATAPIKEGRAWVTPTDPYQKLENTPPKLTTPRSREPTARPSLPTAPLRWSAWRAFLLLAGTGAIGWTRFRRYDDKRLDEILNPEGKLPTHLQPEAKDMAQEAGATKPAIKAPPRVHLGPLSKKKGKQGVLAHLSDEEKASMSEEELEELKAQFQKERKRARRAARRAELPTFDPTDPRCSRCSRCGRSGRRGRRPRQGRERRGGLEGQGDPSEGAQVAAPQGSARRPTPRQSMPRAPRRQSRWTRPLPAEATEKPVAEQPGHMVPNGKPPPQAVPPIPVPHVNGGSHGQGRGQPATERHPLTAPIASRLRPSFSGSSTTPGCTRRSTGSSPTRRPRPSARAFRSTQS